MKRKAILPWISIALALASAVGIYFLPEYHLWFLAVLLLNLLAAFVFGKKYSSAALTVCRLLVGALFIFSSFTKGVDPLGTKYKMLDYLSVYGMTWLNDYAPTPQADNGASSLASRLGSRLFTQPSTGPV